MNRETFFEALKDKVASYVLHNFFYLPLTDGTMMSLLTDFHALFLKEGTIEFESHLTKPEPVSLIITVQR